MTSFDNDPVNDPDPGIIFLEFSPVWDRIGLASHWPCVTDNSGIATYRLTALGREMSTPPTLQ